MNPGLTPPPSFLPHPLTVFFCSVFAAVVAYGQSAAQLVEQARADFRLGDILSATHEVQLAVKMDSTNRAALDLRREIIAYCARERAQAVQQGQHFVDELSQQRLKSVIIPSLKCDHANLAGVTDTLKRTVEERSGAPLNVVLAVNLESRSAKVVSLDLTNVPFSEVLGYVGKFCGVRFDFSSNTVFVRQDFSIPPKPYLPPKIVKTGIKGDFPEEIAALSISNMQFAGASLQDILEFLRRGIQEASNGCHSVLFIADRAIPPPIVQMKIVTVDHSSCKFTDALAAVAEAANVRFDWTKDGIVVVRAGDMEGTVYFPTDKPNVFAGRRVDQAETK